LVEFGVGCSFISASNIISVCVIQVVSVCVLFRVSLFNLVSFILVEGVLYGQVVQDSAIYMSKLIYLKTRTLKNI